MHRLLETIIPGFQPSHSSLREKLTASLAAFLAILILVGEASYLSTGFTFKLMVLASMGASAFLMFVVPHSPMSQPWPVLGGHLVSAAVGVACAHWIPFPPLAAAIAVALSIFAMHWMHCLHPPSAATALIAVLGGPEVLAIGWQFCYEIVAINAASMLLLALVINNLIPGRRYPMRHSHHPHHAQFVQPSNSGTPKLEEQDFDWALDRMDGLVDVSAEDLVDLYEFAVEHAQSRNAGTKNGRADDSRAAVH